MYYNVKKEYMITYTNDCVGTLVQEQSDRTFCSHAIKDRGRHPRA